MNKRYKDRRVLLIEMIGEPHMKSGLLGTIQHEDDAKQIHVNWDNGSHLALIPEQDKYKILTDKDIRKMKLNEISNR